jgi:hydroxymethylpyrimidine pyrophosphatase-like HAD family hydrolase
MGKPVIVSQIGSFEEYPDAIVLKVRHDQNEVHEILDALRSLTESPSELEKRSRLALEYAQKHCDIRKNAEKYADFFAQLINGSFQKEPLDALIDKMFRDGRTSRKEIEAIVENEL